MTNKGMPPAREASPLLKTREGVAVTAFFGAVIVGATYVTLVVSYEMTADAPFGIPPELQKLVGAAYGPIVISSIAGFRDALGAIVQFGDEPPARVPLRRGGVYIYSWVIGGLLAAMAAMLFIASGASVSLSERALALGAAIWAGSVGYVFDKFFRVLRT